MRRIVALAILTISCGGILKAQQPTPQTARQALLEMFFSKTSGTFVKHLPATTLAALEKAGAMTSLQQYSLLTAQMQTQQSSLQTFDTGAVLLSWQDPKTGRVEVAVEKDSLHEDQDDIELSFRIYKNGELQRTAFMPHLTFSMKQEAQTWKLNEISVTVHLPLADPEFLKTITEKMKPQVQAQSQLQATTFTQRGDNVMQPAGSDAMVIAAMRTIAAAENTYAHSYPTVGYTCTLSSLDGFGGGEANEHQAMLINSGLASGKRYGYIFTLNECSGTPASSFKLTAAPNGNSFGRKTFCADQTGVLRSADAANAASCLVSGTPIQ